MNDAGNLLVYVLLFGIMGALCLAEVVKRYPLHTPKRALNAGFFLGVALYAILRLTNKL